MKPRDETLWGEPLTPEEEAYEARMLAELGEEDPRMEQLSLYIVGQLPPGEMAEVEARLLTDAEYRAYAAPLLLLKELRPRIDVSVNVQAEALCQRVVHKMRGRDERGVPLQLTGHSQHTIMNRRLWLAAIQTVVILVGGFVMVWFFPPPFLEPKFLSTDERSGPQVLDAELVVRAVGTSWAIGPRKADSTGRHVFRGEGTIFWTVEPDAKGVYELLTPSARISGGPVKLEIQATTPTRTVVKAESGEALVESRGLTPPASVRLAPGEEAIVEYGKAPEVRIP